MATIKDETRGRTSDGRLAKLTYKAKSRIKCNASSNPNPNYPQHRPGDKPWSRFQRGFPGRRKQNVACVEKKMFHHLERERNPNIQYFQPGETVRVNGVLVTKNDYRGESGYKLQALDPTVIINMTRHLACDDVSIFRPLAFTVSSGYKAHTIVHMPNYDLLNTQYTKMKLLVQSQLYHSLRAKPPDKQYACILMANSMVGTGPPYTHNERFPHATVLIIDFVNKNVQFFDSSDILRAVHVPGDDHLFSMLGYANAAHYPPNGRPLYDFYVHVIDEVLNDFFNEHFNFNYTYTAVQFENIGDCVVCSLATMEYFCSLDGGMRGRLEELQRKLRRDYAALRNPADSPTKTKWLRRKRRVTRWLNDEYERAGAQFMPDLNEP